MESPVKYKKIYGLIGYPLSHSFSQKYFREKFIAENIKDSDYLNFPIESINLITNIISENETLQGFNVTIPYKEQILDYLDEIDPHARQIGAVNTVKCIRKSGKIYLKGYNTDYHGFTETLKPYLKGTEKKALVVGNGGAAKAIIYALTSLNIDTIIVSRKGNKSGQIIQYEDLNEEIFKNLDVIVNTTPLGMWPNINDCPLLPYHLINNGTIAYDLIYNPENTLFMQQAYKFGAIVVNGLEMLKHQAEKAWEIFNIEEV